MKVILLTLFFFIAMTKRIQVVNPKMHLVNTKPGIKFDYPEKTLTYMINQIFPWVEKQFQHVKFDNIHEVVSVPVVGKVTFDINNGELTKIKFSAPTFKIVGTNQIMLSIDSVNIQGLAYWAYKQKSIPHVKDHGSFDLNNLLISLGIQFGATIDPSHKSNIKITSSNFQIQWKQFDVKVHGGASWLYNFLIKEFKGPLEKIISKALEGTIPNAIESALQPVVDAMVYTYPVGIGDIKFSFKLEEIQFDATKKWMAFGADGFFLQGSKTPPGSAGTMPDIYGDQMMQLFFSEFSFGSVIWAANEAGLLVYVVQDDPALPIHLNTAAFKMFIPALYQQYPDQPMQVTINVDKDNLPAIHFNKTAGYQIDGNFNTVFQVKNGSSIVDAFTLIVTSQFNVSIDFKPGSKPYAYKISAKVGLMSFSLKLGKSAIGTFDPAFLEDMINSFLEFFVLPNLNKYFLAGIELPSSEYFQPSNPKLTLFDGYFLASFDFSFFPPSIEG